MEADESVDFDFFDSPRKETIDSPKSTGKSISMSSKPPRNLVNENPVVVVEKSPRMADKRQDSGIKKYSRPDDTFKSGKEVHYSDDSSSESDTESDTPRVERAPAKSTESKFNDKRSVKYRKPEKNISDSSSAYSNSDSDDSSDESPYQSPKREKARSTIEVTLPSGVQEAWSVDEGRRCEKSKNRDNEYGNRHSTKDRYESIDERPQPNRNAYRDAKHYSDSESDNDVSRERDVYRRSGSKYYENGRQTSSKAGNSNEKRTRTRKTLKSNSSSHSNNSDITEVSPLESPEISPRVVRKRYYDSDEKENGDVQYDHSSSRSPDGGADIHLQNEQIDLSILMKCMADIDREKQQRLKSNARRVMFAPPVANEKRKQNHSFTVNRARLIERENQRLLNQIMQQVHRGSDSAGTERATRLAHVPKRATEPVIQRLTPSAVNRQRDQRRIETENMNILKRLQTVRPTRGMARQEQIDEFDRTVHYGMPTCVLTSDRKLHSSMGSSHSGQQWSRPSSAKSNMSTTVSSGRRSRPSSAKSNASVISNASVRSRRSNVSTRSNASMRSNMSMRSGRSVLAEDHRPSWDDRFSYS